MEKVKNNQHDAKIAEMDDVAVYADADPAELPENAFRELGADEHYRPIMHPARDYKEVTVYSVVMGLVLCVIFSAAAAYLGLKVGQVFEAAIPIHTSGAVYPPGKISGDNGEFLPDIPEFAFGWYPGDIVFHSIQEIFREGYARQISFSGGYSYNTGACQWAKRRCAGWFTGQDAGNCFAYRWYL